MQQSFRTRLLAVVSAAVATVVLAPARGDDTKPNDGWVSLFNGKDLSGWKIHPEPNKGQIKKVIAKEAGGKVVGYDAETKDGKTVSLWSIKDGTLIGAGPASHLFSEKDDYDNFHYRVEAKINEKGNSGQYFRTRFESGFPPGYEAQINATGGDRIKTGSLYPDGRTKLKEFSKEICVMDKAAHKADEFFTQEVIADGNHIRIIVNGKTTVDFKDPNNTFTKGHFALQGHDPGTVVTFRKIEYKPIKK
jgi:hypothetical protein